MGNIGSFVPRGTSRHEAPDGSNFADCDFASCRFFGRDLTLPLRSRFISFESLEAPIPRFEPGLSIYSEIRARRGARIRNSSASAFGTSNPAPLEILRFPFCYHAANYNAAMHLHRQLGL